MKSTILVNDSDYGKWIVLVNEKDEELVAAYIKRFYREAKSSAEYHPFNWIEGWLNGIADNISVEFHPVDCTIEPE